MLSKAGPAGKLGIFGIPCGFSGLTIRINEKLFCLMA
jgi:hypothetical protein